LFEQDDELRQLWQSNVRDWKALPNNGQYYFLLEAIDKIISDAKDQLYEDGLEKVAPLVMQKFKENLTRFQGKIS